MTAEILQMISMICFVLAGLLLMISVVLFIRFQIPKVIGELSGATERKAIESIHEQNKQEKQSSDKATTGYNRVMNITEKIHWDSPETEVLLSTAEETTILQQNPIAGSGFVVEDEIIFIHTNEIIN